PLDLLADLPLLRLEVGDLRDRLRLLRADLGLLLLDGPHPVQDLDLPRLERLTPSLDPRLDLVPLPGAVRPHRLEAGRALRGLRGGLPRDANHPLRRPPLLRRHRRLLRLGPGRRLRL